MMDAKVKKSCPNCSQIFSLQNTTKQPKHRIPLLLPCGHSTCQNCLKNTIKFTEPLQCKICLHQVQISSEDMKYITKKPKFLYTLFPVDVYLVGQLAQPLLEIDNSTINKQCEDEDYIDLKAILQSVNNSYGICVECQSPTLKMCQQCAVILCDNCFNKIHNQTFQSFKNHIYKNIEQRSKPNLCEIHKEKPLDYYCVDCSKVICMDCMMVGGAKSCKTHNIISANDKNTEFKEELETIAPKVNEIYLRLTDTALNVGNLLKNLKDKESTSQLCRMAFDIQNHFNKLHGLIQKHEYETMLILENLMTREKNSLLNMKKEITDYLKKTNSIVNKINSVLKPNNIPNTNLANLLEEAKQAVDIPWYLNKGNDNENNFNMAINEDLCNLVKDYVHLDVNSYVGYNLLTSQDIGDDVIIPPVPTKAVFPPEMQKDVREVYKPKKLATPTRPFYDAISKYHSKHGSNSSINSVGTESNRFSISSEESHYPVLSVAPFKESRHPKPLQEGSQEVIYISHIVDPHNFFVQRSCQQELVKELMKEFRNASTLQKPSIASIHEGKYFLAYNEPDNQWHRCRILSIDRKNIDQPIYQIFCHDYGITEFVTIEKLRVLPAARIQTPPPLAIHCSLTNCQPIAGEWTSEDSLLMQKIIYNKQAVIYVTYVKSVSSCNVKFECHITTYDDGVNLTQALVFHERARLINPVLPYPKLNLLEDKPKLFFSNNDFKPNSIEEVIITHIVSPDKFYVRKTYLQDAYDKLCDELDQAYSLRVQTGTIYCPTIGMVCVAHAAAAGEAGAAGEAAGGWRRAVVRELPGRLRARVALPDSGAGALLHVSALRAIHPKFTTQKTLAVECHLSGITPFNKKWSTGSVALLESFQGHCLELVVEEETHSRGSLGVTLVDNTDEDNKICVNNEMIQHKFAITIGICMSNKPKMTEKPVYTRKLPFETKSAPTQKNKKKITILSRKEPVAKKINDEDLQAKDKGPFKLEVKVLSCQSPSVIYVSLIDQQKSMKELFELIQEYYNKNKSQNKIEWKVGDRCCSFYNESKTWRRAVIMELDGGEAKVFYIDFACVEKVNIAELKQLAPEFAEISGAAIKCHLCGVIPAVGDEWPSLTKEYLKELIDAYQRIFITKNGNIKDKSLPVELWVYHITQGGALEPNTAEWRCLNKKIIEQGLGVPDQSQKELQGNAEGIDDVSSFIHITGSLKEWLQLESSSQSSVFPENIREYNDLEEDDKSSDNTMVISDWLPPEPLRTTEFTGMPTYIDYHGVIYLHDIIQEDTLDLIRKALDQFNANVPTVVHRNWSVGEPCIARFYLDNRFYRGRIIEVNQETSSCLIHYIDYGNEEFCAFNNMRKTIALYKIPTQAHKCILNLIKPVGDRWTKTTLDYIHKIIVEKKCLVKVSGDKVGDQIPIELKINQLWLHEHLVEFEQALYTDGSKPIVPKYVSNVKECNEYEKNKAQESDSDPDYIVEESDTNLNDSQEFLNNSMDNKDWNELMEEELCDKPKDLNFITYECNSIFEQNNTFTCRVSVMNVNSFEVTVVHDDDTKELYEKMCQEIQAKGKEMENLNGVFENKACIAFFEDKQWYRALILEYSEPKRLIKVKSVDYGDTCILSIDNVREIDHKWLELPPAAISIKLLGITTNPDMDEGSIINEYEKTFLDKPYIAEIVKKDDTFAYVHLRDEAGGNLVYQNLIDNGIFLKSDVTLSD